MFLHLTPDAQFIDSIINKIKKGGNINHHTFYVYNKNSKKEISKINNVDSVDILNLDKKKRYSDIDKKNQFRFIIIHCLVNEAIDFILKVPPSKKVYWIFWGGDFYKPITLFLNKLLQPKTKKWYLQFSKKNKILPNCIVELKLYLKAKLSNYQKNKTKAIKRIDYFLHWNKIDYDIVNKYYPIPAKFFPFYYGNAASYINTFSPDNYKLKEVSTSFRIDKDERVILLGNSGTITNNHLDIMSDIAKNLHDDKYKIICPLSYGSNSYIKTVIEEGEKIFGLNFIPLTEFIKKDVYFHLLHLVDVAIFNHQRPQAGDNIYTLVSLGKKVFLNKKNSLYQLFKKNKILIFDCKSELSENLLYADLSNENKKYNQNQIKSLFIKPLNNAAELFDFKKEH
jgi:hypothetical protein